MTDNELVERLTANRTPLYYAILDGNDEAYVKHKLIEKRIKRQLERRGYVVTIQNFNVTLGAIAQ